MGGAPATDFRAGVAEIRGRESVCSGLFLSRATADRPPAIPLPHGFGGAHLFVFSFFS